MRKLRLDIDQLVVDSFDTNEAQPGPGTVRAAQDEAAITGWSWLCGTCDGNTCGSTCENTCAETCPFSCAGPNPTACNSRYCHDRPTTEPITVAEPVDPGAFG